MKQVTFLLRKDGGFRLAKNGEILCGSAKVGTWKKEDVWKQHGGNHYNDSGCHLVHFLWTAQLADGSNLLIAYTRNELRDMLDGRRVKVYV